MCCAVLWQGMRCAVAGAAAHQGGEGDHECGVGAGGGRDVGVNLPLAGCHGANLLQGLAWGQGGLPAGHLCCAGLPRCQHQQQGEEEGEQAAPAAAVGRRRRGRRGRHAYCAVVPSLGPRVSKGCN